jgi:hypothetical protein
VAALLAFVQPGLGHAYLRAPLRALLWFGLWVGTVVLVTPDPTGSGVFEALLDAMGAFGSLPLEAALALVSVTVFSTLDAYLLAVRADRRRERAGPTCPSCGRAVDEDLAFCQWCTEPIEGGETESVTP